MKTVFEKEELQAIATDATSPFDKWPRWAIELDVDLSFQISLLDDDERPMVPETELSAERRGLEYARDALSKWVTMAYGS